MKNNPGTPLTWSDPCGQFFKLDKADSHGNTDFPDLDKPVPELGFFKVQTREEVALHKTLIT